MCNTEGPAFCRSKRLGLRCRVNEKNTQPSFLRDKSFIFSIFQSLLCIPYAKFIVKRRISPITKVIQLLHKHHKNISFWNKSAPVHPLTTCLHIFLVTHAQLNIPLLDFTKARSLSAITAYTGNSFDNCQKTRLLVSFFIF